MNHSNTRATEIGHPHGSFELIPMSMGRHALVPFAFFKRPTQTPFSAALEQVRVTSPLSTLASYLLPKLRFLRFFREERSESLLRNEAATKK